MDVKIEAGWKAVLSGEFGKDYFKDLTNFVRSEYKNHTCYPPASEIFAAFNACPFEAVKVVIIGQDPYHGPGQANGLCFSVHDGVPQPPSLVNIFKEVETDTGKPIPKSGDLMPWARQGILLLNATLTVRAGLAGSHQNKGWEIFTDAVIEQLSFRKEHLVFLLWGGYAKNKGSRIDGKKHLVLNAGHPSPLSANRGLWFGNRHFSKTNAYLKDHDSPQILW